MELNQHWVNWLISVDRQLSELSNKPNSKQEVSILYETIKEFIDTQIQIRKKKINSLTENYNLVFCREKRKSLAQYVDEINELNSLQVEIGKLFNRVIELS